jgi:hypothetical protein
MATLSAISAKAGYGYCRAPTLSWKVNTELPSLFVYLFFGT